MSDSLLVTLRSYRPRRDRDSLENFVTEVFCWLLRHSTDLTSAFLERVNKALDEDMRFSLPDEDVQWETQFSLGAKRPDMAASWSGMCLIFEHKVGAPRDQEQLANYRSAVESHHPSDNHRLILITATTADHSREADACLCWSDVHKIVEQLVENNGEADKHSHLTDFLDLLIHEGLGPPAPIAHQALRYYPIARDLPMQLESVLSPLQHQDWLVSDRYLPKFKSHWGRIGLEFYRRDVQQEWSPGLFLGSVLDGRDHCVSHRHKDALQLQLIVDFDRHLFGTYPTMVSYRALKERLAAVAPDQGWSFYDHLADARGANRYHPLYLERPLLNVFQGATTCEEQQQKFYAMGQQALGLVEEAGLAELMAECDAACGYNDER